MTQDDFYKWLDSGPVQWFKSYEDDDSVNICFLLPVTNTEDDDD